MSFGRGGLQGRRGQTAQPPYPARRRSPTSQAQLFILDGSHDGRGPPAGGTCPRSASRDLSFDRRRKRDPSRDRRATVAESATRPRPRPEPSAPHPWPGRAKTGLCQGCRGDGSASQRDRRYCMPPLSQYTREAGRLRLQPSPHRRLYFLHLAVRHLGKGWLDTVAGKGRLLGGVKSSNKDGTEAVLSRASEIAKKQQC
eukprot:361747-Chlamydomonas_euryale.AAC.5